MAPVGAVIPVIPVDVDAAVAALVENAAALLSVAITVVAVDAGTKIIASTLTLAVAGDDVPVTPPTANVAALAVKRSAFAAARVVDETSYVTDNARSRRRLGGWGMFTFVIALASTFNAVAAAVLNALSVGVEAKAKDIEPETTYVS
jgi:hypothetical protein